MSIGRSPPAIARGLSMWAASTVVPSALAVVTVIVKPTIRRRSRGFSLLEWGNNYNCPKLEQCMLLLRPTGGRQRDVVGLRRPPREMPRPSIGRFVTPARAARCSPALPRCWPRRPDAPRSGSRVSVLARNIHPWPRAVCDSMVSL